MSAPLFGSILFSCFLLWNELVVCERFPFSFLFFFFWKTFWMECLFSSHLFPSYCYCHFCFIILCYCCGCCYFFSIELLSSYITSTCAQKKKEKKKKVLLVIGGICKILIIFRWFCFVTPFVRILWLCFCWPVGVVTVQSPPLLLPSLSLSIPHSQVREGMEGGGGGGRMNRQINMACVLSVEMCFVSVNILTQCFICYASL